MMVFDLHILDALERAAVSRPSRTAFRYYDAKGAESCKISAAALCARAHHKGSALRTLGLRPGTPMLVGCSDPQTAVDGFLAVSAAGGIPVMVPARGKVSRRLSAIIADCTPFGMILDDRLAKLRRGASPVPIFCLSELDGGGSIAPLRGAAQPAFIQYTSGTTGKPKGVVITHGNLAANSSMIAAAFGHSPETRFASWVPLFHDMGLVGATLHPLLIGAEATLMPPEAFVRAPETWLRMVSEVGATTSGAPDFAYRACLSAESMERLGAVDLSCWTVAYTGAEPVRASTIDDFSKAMKPYGFSPDAWLPCYGLAETTLLSAGRKIQIGLTVLDPPMGTPKSVSLGPPVPGCVLRIVSPDSATPVPDGDVAEIWIAGPHVATAYWGRPEPLPTGFLAEAPGIPFLRTGDLGLMVDGNLHFAGRLTEMLNLGGRNIYPDDLERALDGQAGLRDRGFVITAMAAQPFAETFGVAAARGQEIDRLVLLIESDSIHDASMPRRAADILADCAECNLAAVVFVSSGALEFTTSGKLNRAAVRRKLESGGIRIARAWISPLLADPAAEATSAVAAALRQRVSEAALVAKVAEAVRMLLGETGPIPTDLPLASLGCNSMGLLRLAQLLQAFDVEDTVSGALHTGLSVAEIARRLRFRPRGADGIAPDGVASVILQRRRLIGDGPYVLSFALSGPESMLSAARAAGLAVYQDFPGLDNRPAAERMPPPLRELGCFSDIRALEAGLAADQGRAFDLDQGPVRLAAGRVRGGDSALLVSIHHAHTDFWAASGVLQRLIDAACGKSGPPRLMEPSRPARPLPVRSEPLRDTPPLPRDFNRPAGGTPICVPVCVPAPTVAKLIAASGQTPFVALSTCLAIAFGRWSGHWNTAVAVPRRHIGGATEGYGVEIARLVWSVDASTSFADAAQTMAREMETALTGHAADALPPAEIAHVHIPRTNDASDDFARLVLRDDRSRIKLRGVGVWSAGLGPGSLELPVECVSCEENGALLLSIRFDGALFAPETARGLAEAVGRIAKAASEDPDRPASDLFDAGAPLAILNGAGSDEYQPTLHERVLDWAHRQPTARAVESPKGELTYAGLADWSTHYASQIGEQARAGASVGILSDGGPQTICALIGALRAGMRVVLIDPDLPKARMGAIADDADIALFVAATADAGHHLRPVLTMTDIAPCSEPLPDLPHIDPTADAYAVFTSGTTGGPKGIAHTHQSFEQFLNWQSLALLIGPGARVAQLAAPGFDVAFCEIFGALCLGATLVLPDRNRDIAPEALFDWISRNAISSLQITPSMLTSALARTESLPACLETLATVGEPLAPALARRVRKFSARALRIVNIYGPSETIAASWHLLGPEDADRTLTPAGQPITGRNIEIRSADGTLLPLGVPGDICVRTCAMSQGYLADSNAVAFLELPNGPSRQPGLFRTGDLGQIGFDGLLRVTGRSDLQVKINGIRIELAEIECVLATFPGVVAAIVVPQQMADGGMRLSAVVQAVASVDLAALRRHALAVLPGHQVPQHMIRVNDLPRTGNGKADRKGAAELLASVATGPASAVTRDTTPLTTLESDVAQEWSMILPGLQQLDTHSNFFACGGHSIAAMRLLNRVSDRFGCVVPLSRFLAAPTLGALARSIAETRLPDLINAKDN